MTLRSQVLNSTFTSTKQTHWVLVKLHLCVTSLSSEMQMSEWRLKALWSDYNVQTEDLMVETVGEYRVLIVCSSRCMTHQARGRFRGLRDEYQLCRMALTRQLCLVRLKNEY